MHADGVLGSYYITNNTIKGVDYYRMLDTNAQSEPQQFPHDAVFRFYLAPPHITCVVIFVLDEMFLSSWVAT